jgi:anaerobic ribonucleoside-triphosphate reductase activating protein
MLSLDLIFIIMNTLCLLFTTSAVLLLVFLARSLYLIISVTKVGGTMKIHSTAITFSDLPNHVSLSIYSVGCSLGCQGCHNPELISFEHPGATVINIDSLLEKIKVASELIDAIVWTGGEPTLQSDLGELSKRVKEAFPAIIQVLYTGREFNNIAPEHLEHMTYVKAGPYRGVPVTVLGSNQSFWTRQDGRWTRIGYEHIR